MTRDRWQTPEYVEANYEPDPFPRQRLDCPPALLNALRRASTHAAEARQRDAARRAEEERGETAREWAWRNAAEMRAGT